MRKNKTVIKSEVMTVSKMWSVIIVALAVLVVISVVLKVDKYVDWRFFYRSRVDIRLESVEVRLKDLTMRHNILVNYLSKKEEEELGTNVVEEVVSKKGK